MSSQAVLAELRGEGQSSPIIYIVKKLRPWLEALTTPPVVWSTRSELSQATQRVVQVPTGFLKVKDTILTPPATSQTVKSIIRDLHSLLEMSKPSILSDLTVLAEYAILADWHIDHLVVLPSNDPGEWCGLVTPTEGRFCGHALRFTVNFPPNYPDSAPSVYFEPIVDHPLIDQTDGRLTFASEIAPWSPQEHCVVQVLSFLRRVFFDSSLLPEGSEYNLHDRKSALIKGSFEHTDTLIPMDPLQLEPAPPWIEEQVQKAQENVGERGGESGRSLWCRSSGYRVLEASGLGDVGDRLWDRFIEYYSPPT